MKKRLQKMLIMLEAAGKACNYQVWLPCQEGSIELISAISGNYSTSYTVALNDLRGS